MTDILEFCQAILHMGLEEEVDLFAENELKRTFYEYKAAQKKPLAGVTYMVNGSEYASLLDAMHAEEKLENLGMRFMKPNLKENWDFNTPTKTLVLMGNGMGVLERFSYDSFKLDKWDKHQQIQRDNVMIRGYPTWLNYPQSIKTKSVDPLAAPIRPYIPKLITLEKLWDDIREHGMVVFELRVCAYTKTARFNYDIDLVNNVMLKDFRGGQSPLRNRAERSILDYFNFDMVLASTDMKEIVKKTFTNLFESKHATAFDFAHSMHITNQMAANALNAIVTRGLARKEGSSPREVYSIDPEALAESALKLEKY
ncbi:MAG: hypothetical protein KKH41_04170 [Candidatus Thermoplasmatota archaeon]|nr:hypothetical protein [Euryarchaeota archaeon]MBU4031502.1 hypothetical protein [Candidatus Thermoplasmatota archaeon]MBU4070877.1 hypothetical protein [Candidatus Thermoplasmatota archaeon]MBU4143577.1 hypothetical protein [Candidatus Thermoplasmatota archaeon]MBU4591764.1 hypothetical protein [Candidatus Thermoplasmatota archaeon]